jgi:thiol-disulfide isomerase/thioredoxin
MFVPTDPYTILIVAWVFLTGMLTGIVAYRILRHQKVMNRTVRILGVLSAILLALVLSLTFWIYSRGGFGAEHIGHAPEFSFTSLDGQTISSRSLRGKVVLLDFWATWCAPCVATLPAMARLQEQFSNRPFVLVGVSVDTEEDSWREFLATHKIGGVEYLDRDQQLRNKFQAPGPPTYVLIDLRGNIQFRQIGWAPTTYIQLKLEIEKALNSNAGAHQP